ncbi:MAG: Fic family protein [Prevotella sp.]|nr:Fic family protein [Candidatus Prevotella equi]
MDNSREILQFLHYNPLSSREEIAKGIAFEGSDATLKRLIAALVRNEDVVVEGKARATRYRLSNQAHLLMPLNLNTYFSQDVDERKVQTSFNFELIREQIPEVSIFSNEERIHLNELQKGFRQHIEEMTPNEYNKEMERLGIDLSWKSSQIEGNTYSLLETERLLRESKTADGKTQEEATMLLNHKYALRFILDNPDYLQELTVSHIEDIHSLLTQGLSVDKGIRHRRVGITGTNYHPLDNEFQIREAMRDTCNLINNKVDIFEKALLTLVLLSYIQAFSDGNKRTARITSNAILIANGYCPLSFRSVDSIDYKKAMLIFYEQNNLYAFKQIFIEQFEFAVKEYF